jgi:hypothetical protein
MRHDVQLLLSPRDVQLTAKFLSLEAVLPLIDEDDAESCWFRTGPVNETSRGIEYWAGENWLSCAITISESDPSAPGTDWCRSDGRPP